MGSDARTSADRREAVTGYGKHRLDRGTAAAASSQHVISGLKMRRLGEWVGG